MRLAAFVQLGGEEPTFTLSPRHAELDSAFIVRWAVSLEERTAHSVSSRTMNPETSSG
jgi:hypothetical protein